LDDAAGFQLSTCSARHSATGIAVTAWRRDKHRFLGRLHPTEFGKVAPT